MPLASLFGVLALFVLAAVQVSSVVWNALRHRWWRALSCGWVVAAYIALVPLPLTPEYFVQQVRLGNWVRFLMTYAWIARPMQAQAPGPDRLVRAGWGVSGFAGISYDAYLVFDAPGRFAEPASRPDGDFGLACPIVTVQPLLQPWVIVTTFNCTL